jgi:hypothetical protein
MPDSSPAGRSAEHASTTTGDPAQTKQAAIAA